MLILSRKSQEKILIGDDIVITVVQVKFNQVRLGIDAPRDVNIVRQELVDPLSEKYALKVPLLKSS